MCTSSMKVTFKVFRKSGGIGSILSKFLTQGFAVLFVLAAMAMMCKIYRSGFTFVLYSIAKF